jgi:hypothetical protein
MLSSICTLEHFIQLGSGVFALIAAIFWGLSTRAKAISKIPPQQMSAGWGGNIPGLVALVKDVEKQSRLNAWAAFFAAVAALCQIPLAFMPACWSGSPWFG